MQEHCLRYTVRDHGFIQSWFTEAPYYRDDLGQVRCADYVANLETANPKGTA
jgi:hypothetical protein